LDKPIKFDRHARRRMKWRRISEEEVYLTIENPDKVEESIKGRVNLYKSIRQQKLFHASLNNCCCWMVCGRFKYWG